MKNSKLRKAKAIVILAVMGLFAVSSFAQFGGGDGTAGNPYQIGRAEHLNEIRGQYLVANIHFVQTANINLDEAPYNQGQGWTPIGDNATNFQGNFNGGEFTISGLTINRVQSYQGLFGYTNVATIQNVTLLDIDITGGTNTGGLVGRCNNTRVDRCEVSGIITAQSTSGGLAGYYSGQITDSYAHVDIECPNGDVIGGLLGDCWGDMRRCGATGNVVGRNTVGGLVGDSYNNHQQGPLFAHGDVTGVNRVGGVFGLYQTATYYDVYQTGKVTGVSQVGGIVGRSEISANIYRAYAIGRVVADDEGGGIVGSAHANAGAVNSCYWNIESTGQGTSFGGTPKTTMEMLSQDTYAGWNFAGGIWRIDEGSYPYLSIEGDEAGPHNFPGDLRFPPTGLRYTIGDDRDEINLFWDEPTLIEPIGYHLYRNDNRINQELLTNTRFTDTNVEIWAWYRYGVSAVYLVNGDPVESDRSGVVKAVIAGFEGSGSSADPYQVATAEHLNKIREFLDSHFIQTANISLGEAPWNEGEGWIPLSDNNTTFRGTYNGDGFAIEGLTINRNAPYQSLFGYGIGATVANVLLKDVDITGSYYTGAFFGYTTNTAIRNSCVEGSVKGTYYMGGLVGIVSGGSITGCYIAGEVVVPGTSTTGYIGGFAGQFSGNANLTNCYSTAMVKGNQTRIGGLLGYNNAIINNSYCTGAVIAVNEAAFVGGLIGESTGGAVNNSFWNVETTGRETSPGGGTGTGTSLMVRRGTYTDVNWEFPDVWSIVEGETYPFLAWEDGPSFHNRPGPSGLTADGDHEAREIALEWNMIGNPNRYNVYRNNVLLRSVNHPTRELLDTNLELFVEYSYFVEAIFIEGEEELVSAPSNTVIVVLAPPFAGGDGSADNPYQVANESHLSMLRYFPAAHFIQTAHLDLHREAWVPIGDNNIRFRGTYDGNGFRISEMNINSNAAYQGLFGYAQNATLRNITFEDVELRMGQYSGALSGRTETTNISNVTVTGNIQAVSSYVGGLVGYATNGTFSNCSYSGTMTASTNYVGGLLGSGYVTINDCWTDIELTTSGGYAGGLVGSAASTLNINRCAVLGNITSTSTLDNLYIGGIIGWTIVTTITDSYVTGNVISSAPGGRNYVGGLIGAKTQTCFTILRSYMAGNVTGRNYVGGLVGAIQNTNATSIEDCYAMGTVTGVDHVGGLIGGNASASQSVLRSYSIGRVFGDANVGGLIGSGNGPVTNSYWNTETSGQEESPGGGLARDNRHMRYPYTEDTYIGWNFETVWAHDVDPSWNDGYPRLHWQERPIEFIEAPQVRADIVQIDGTDHFRIRWELVEGARSYRIYSSLNPTVANWGDPISTVGQDVTTYTEAVGETKGKYFYVTASTREAR